MAKIVVAPETTDVDAGNTVLFTCVALGDSLPSITWSRQNGSVLDNDTGVTIYEELVSEGGLIFVQSILEVCSVEELDSGNYSCSADNDFGSDTSTFELTVSAEGNQ